MAAHIRFGHLLCAGLLALLAACNHDDDDGAAADARSMQLIGAAGGQLTSPDGSLTLQVPAGALPQDTQIAVVEVAAANQSALVRAQKPQRVYRLEPEGLNFAQPVTATIDMPPSAAGQLVFALLYSGGRFTPLQQLTLAFGAGQRRMTAQITHFSELVVLEEQGTTVIATVSPRSIMVGDTLDATLSVSKQADGAQVTVEAQIDYIATSNPADLVFEKENLTDFYVAVPPVMLRAGAAESKASLQTWRCVNPHTGAMRFSIGLTLPLPIFDVDGSLLETSTMTVSRLEPAEIDYICNAGAPPAGALQTGLFSMPFGMTLPNELYLIDGAFANLAGNGPFVSIAGNNGAVVIDLRTGLSALNMTPSGPDRRLGNGELLGALPVSQPAPGPSTVAGLFATGAQGAVRSYTPDGQGGFVWGATLLALNQVIDASASGGGYVADEVVTTEPRSGLNTWSVQSTFWQFDAQIRALWFQGSLISATAPVKGGPVLALSTGTDAGATSTVWVHDRTQAPAKPLFSIAGAQARRLRCLDAVLPAGPSGGAAGYLCGATESGGTLAVFRHDPTDPFAIPAWSALPVGKGALGLGFGWRTGGTPVAVVANEDDQTLNLADFDRFGILSANRTVSAPAGCVNPAHAVPVAAGGKDYIVGSCYGSGHWFSMEMPPPPAPPP